MTCALSNYLSEFPKLAPSQQSLGPLVKQILGPCLRPAEPVPPGRSWESGTRTSGSQHIWEIDEVSKILIPHSCVSQI